ncbi:DUF3977 family protein [Bacillus fonticola]
MGPIKCHSIYIRFWIRETVFILDLKEGFKRNKKKRSAFKAVVGSLDM